MKNRDEAPYGSDMADAIPRALPPSTPTHAIIWDHEKYPFAGMQKGDTFIPPEELQGNIRFITEIEAGKY